MSRQSTGIPELDQCLGGGLIPGTLTVVVGSTGIGKTQLGVHYAHAGFQHDARSGVFFDMSARGDGQSHADYALRMKEWDLVQADPEQKPDLPTFFDPATEYGDLLHVLNYQGRRVSKRDLDWDAWHHWQGQLNEKLQTAIGFLYGNLARGCRRVVIDGIEPVDIPGESIQFNLFEYVYHQVLRKDPMWVARDFFRQEFRKREAEAETHNYDPRQVGCLLLQTAKESMLDDLISKPLDEGDLLATANTVIYMGKIIEGKRIGRAIYIPKHRGSAVAEEIIPYRIDDGGLQLEV